MLTIVGVVDIGVVEALGTTVAGDDGRASHPPNKKIVNTQSK
jgi:hypothetical protein